MDSNAQPQCNSLREIISKMSGAQHIQIMREYDEYEQDGTTGDSLLRLTAESVATSMGGGMIWMTMNLVAFETYRYIAKHQQRNYVKDTWGIN